MKGVSCSMSMLKGKGLLYLLGMNLFEKEDNLQVDRAHLQQNTLLTKIL